MNNNQKNILTLTNLNKTFVKKNGFKKIKTSVLKNISLRIKKGETYGLVGESGSGKSTIANIIMGIVKKDLGVCKFNDKEFDKTPKKIQMVFQDAFSSLNPIMTVGYLLEESLIINGVFSKLERKKRVIDIIQKVGLSEFDLNKKPSSFSGGQCQRIAIARALIVDPELIILDEAVSALDVSIQSKILNLLVKLQNELQLSYLFISHDLRVVNYISDVVGVIYQGKIVEENTPQEIFKNPQHEYTKKLIASILSKD